MLYYDRIDVSGGIDVNKTNSPKECIIYHYWYLLDKGFKFQPNVCNGCHNILIMSMNFNDYCIINGISKGETVNLLQNADLSKKSG